MLLKIFIFDGYDLCLLLLLASALCRAVDANLAQLDCDTQRPLNLSHRMHGNSCYILDCRRVLVILLLVFEL